MNTMKRKKILVLCPSPQGTNPGQRLKYEQYFKSWNKAGYDVTVSSFQTPRFWKIIYQPGHIPEKIWWTIFGFFKRVFDILRMPFYDGVYVFLWVTPIGLPLMENLVSIVAKHLIYDIDDMVYLGDTSAANKWIAKLKGPEKMILLMKNANHVIVSTPRINEYVAQYNPHRTYISTTYNTDRFVPVAAYHKHEVTTLGWTGSHTTIKYLHLLDNVFKELSKLRKIKVLAISNGTYTCEGVNVENVTWTEANEISDLHRIEIGLYPITKDEWALGKNACKSMTYMSCALPSVATNYGPSLLVVDNGINGFLADTDQQWVDVLVSLIDNIELRKQIGLNGRQKAVNQFSVKANEGKYLKVLEQVFGK